MAWAEWRSERAAWIGLGTTLLATVLGVVLTRGGDPGAVAADAMLRIDDVRLGVQADVLELDVALTRAGDIGIVTNIDVEQVPVFVLACTDAVNYSVDVLSSAEVTSSEDGAVAMRVTQQDPLGDAISARAFVTEVGCTRSAGVNLRAQLALDDGQDQIELGLPTSLLVTASSLTDAFADDPSGDAFSPSVGDDVELFRPGTPSAMIVTVRTSLDLCAYAVVDLRDPLAPVVDAETAAGLLADRPLPCAGPV